MFHSIPSPFRENKLLKQAVLPFKAPRGFSKLSEVSFSMKIWLVLIYSCSKCPQNTWNMKQFQRARIWWLLNFYEAKGNKNWMKVWMKVAVCWNFNAAKWSLIKQQLFYLGEKVDNEVKMEMSLFRAINIASMKMALHTHKKSWNFPFTRIQCFSSTCYIFIFQFALKIP